MRLVSRKFASVLFACLTFLSVSGVFAFWQYFDPIEPMFSGVSVNLNEFNYDPGEILYISDIELVSSSNLSSQLSYGKSLPTYVSVKGNLGRAGGKVTYKVTVFNNTDVTYWYVGQKLPEYGTNALISSNKVVIQTKEKTTDSTNTFNSADWIPARTERDFYVTYNFDGVSSGAIDLYVNYYFSIRMDAVEDEFLKILNDKETINGYDYLTSVFDDNYAKTGSKQINNVGEDAVFDRLFGDGLTIDVDGVQTPVTVVIERTNVDGKSTGDTYSVNNSLSGCEYTVYVTADSLVSGQRATVYAISYSCGADGVWYKIGQLYEGTAYVANTEDGAMIQVNGDIAEDKLQDNQNKTWVASPEQYVVYDSGTGQKIVYNAGLVNQGDQYDMLKTIKGIMSTQDQDIFNDINNTGIFKKIYDILNRSENKYSTEPEVVNLRQIFEECSRFYKNHNNGQQFEVLRNCTRSEILPYLVKLVDALEYYYVIRGK